MGALRKLAGQTAIYGVSSIVGRLMNYLLFPMYTRVFLPNEYGAVTELYAYVAFLIVLLTYGMETAFFRFSSAESSEENRKRIFSTSFISILFTSGIFLFITIFWNTELAGFLGYGANPEYIRYFAIIVALDAMVTIPFARLRLKNKPIPFALINLGSILFNIALNSFFLLYCPYVLENPDAFGHSLIATYYDPTIGIGYIFIANLMSSALKFLLLTPWMIDITGRWHKAIFDRLLPYALPLLILGLAGIVNETFDRAFFTDLSHLPEAEAKAQLGIYGACYKVAMLLSIGIQAYRFAAEPFVFSLGKSEKSDLIQADIMKYYFIVATLITLTILCFLDIVILMVGADFREGRDVIPILLGAYIFFGALFNLSFWYKTNDKTRYGAFIAITGAVVTVVMNVILVPRIGYYGSAWATFGAYAVMMLLSYHLGQKYYPLPYKMKEIGSYILVATVLYLVHRLLPLEGIFKHLAGAAVVMIYLLFILRTEKTLLLKRTHFGNRNHK